MKISLFVTCLVDQLFPQVGVAAVRLLRHLGQDVDFDPRQTCCGQPALNSGFPQHACEVSRAFLRVFENAEVVVTPSGSCATMVKKFLPELFPEGSRERVAAEAIAGRTWEMSDFLVRSLGIESVGARFDHTVTFHDSCHQFRELGIYEQPRKLMRSVAGLRFVEMENSTRCCGFGGTFAVKFGEISTSLAEDKVATVLKTNAEYVVGTDVSCLMQIEGRLRRQGSSVRAMHLAELLVQGI